MHQLRSESGRLEYSKEATIIMEYTNHNAKKWKHWSEARSKNGKAGRQEEEAKAAMIRKHEIQREWERQRPHRVKA